MIAKIKHLIPLAVIMALGVIDLVVPAAHARGAEPPPRDGELVPIEVTPNSRRAFYLNGINTSGATALAQARTIAECLAMNTTLAYVDCSVPPVDFFAIATSKLGDLDSEFNPAAARVVEAAMVELSAGREVVLLGYSLGGAVVQNIANGLADRLPAASRVDTLKRVAIVLLGAACFAADHPLSDGWPPGSTIFSISDLRDPIARWWGDVDDGWVASRIEAHSFQRYVRHLDQRRTRQSGRLVVDGEMVLLEEVVVAPDPTDLVIRWRCWGIPNESCRRTVNATVPRSWRRVEWSVTGGDESVMLAPMRDLAFMQDEPVFATPVRHGDRGTAPVGERVYLGRVNNVDRATLVSGGLRVAIRPVPSAEPAPADGGESIGN